MGTRAKWTERVRQWERSGLDAAEFATREGLAAETLDGGWRKLQSDAPAALRVEPQRFAVRVKVPMTALAPVWIEIGLPNGALVRVLPGVDAMTFACVLAVATELSAQAATPSDPAPTTQVASRHGRR